jgi:hypothetical protein
VRVRGIMSRRFSPTRKRRGGRGWSFAVSFGGTAGVVDGFVAEVGLGKRVG